MVKIQELVNLGLVNPGLVNLSKSAAGGAKWNRGSDRTKKRVMAGKIVWGKVNSGSDSGTQY